MLSQSMYQGVRLVTNLELKVGLLWSKIRISEANLLFRIMPKVASNNPDHLQGLHEPLFITIIY